MNITFEQVGLFIMVTGFITGIWWKLESKIEDAAKKAREAASDLEKYKTHVAEAYVSKAGLREFRDEVMGAVREIKEGVSHLNTRIDRVIEEKPDKQPRQQRRQAD